MVEPVPHLIFLVPSILSLSSLLSSSHHPNVSVVSVSLSHCYRFENGFMCVSCYVLGYVVCICLGLDWRHRESRVGVMSV